MIRESRTGWGGLGSSNDEITQRIIILSLVTRVLAAKATDAELSSSFSLHELGPRPELTPLLRGIKDDVEALIKLAGEARRYACS